MSKHIRPIAQTAAILIYLIGAVLVLNQIRHAMPLSVASLRFVAQNCIVFAMFSLGMGTILLVLAGLLRDRSTTKVATPPAAAPAQDTARPLQLLQAQIDELGTRLRMMFSLIEER